MKSAMKFLSLLFTVLILTNTANAESPREQLKQMVGQLQANPDDNALREQIIKLAQELKPAPAVPEEAERRMARGTAAFKGAKSVADYRDAAKEFEQATLAAPWYGDAYLNLGVTQDKAENYEAALRSLKLAQLASPNDKEIKALIYEVEYRNEKAHSPEVEAARQAALQREKDEVLIKSLDGSVFVISDPSDGIFGAVDAELHINHGEVTQLNRQISLGAENRKRGHYVGQVTPQGAGKINGRRFTILDGGYERMTAEIAPDGLTIRTLYGLNSTDSYTVIFRRRQ